MVSRRWAVGLGGAAALAALAMPGSVAAQTGRNACFIRIQALRTIPGLAGAIPAGEALNAAAGGAQLQAYDRALASAIAGMGSGPDIALRLLDTESLVFRVSECAAQLALPATQVDRAATALDEAFRANAAHYSLQAPSLADDRVREMLQQRMLASARLAAALAATGRAGERERVLQEEARLEAAADAAAEARWEAGRPQREAEERARWAEADALRIRQTTDQAIPDDELIRRALMAEFREVGLDMTSLNFARGLSEFVTRPGDQPGFSENWNANTGEIFLNFGRDEYAMTQYYRFSVRGADCTRSRAGVPEFSCAFTAQTFIEVTLAGSTLLDNRSAETPVTMPIIWNGSRWSAPSARAAMERAIAQSAIAPTSRSTANPNDALCGSLHAGVAAAGGTSTSAGLNPQTWGC